MSLRHLSLESCVDGLKTTLLPGQFVCDLDMRLCSDMTGAMLRAVTCPSTISLNEVCCYSLAPLAACQALEDLSLGIALPW